MDNKNSFSKKGKGMRFFSQLILLSLFSAAITFADSRRIITGIETYFSDLDLALSAMGQEISRNGPKKAKEPMDKMLQDYPGIESLIWINSKGVVVRETVREGKPGKRHRNLSRQKWYSEIKQLNPYHSSLRTKKGEYKLFWCEPIRIKRSGGDRCGGAIVSRINLKKSLDAVAEKIGKPFRILKKGKPLFSHLWEMSYDSTAVPLTIQGLAAIQINTKKEKPILEAPPSDSAKGISLGAVFKSKLIFVFVAIAIVFFVLLSVIKVFVKMKNDALMRSIEGDEPFAGPKERKQGGDTVKAAKVVLPPKREEDSLSETAVKQSSDEESDIALELEESIAKEGAAITKVEEFSDVAQKKEVKSDMPSEQEEPLVMDSIPSETQILKPDIVDVIKEIKPEEEMEEIPATEVKPETVSSNIMEEVEVLLQKHLKSVLAERVTQIEEDVLARVRDELTGRMKGDEG